MTDTTDPAAVRRQFDGLSEDMPLTNKEIISAHRSLNNIGFPVTQDHVKLLTAVKRASQGKCVRVTPGLMTEWKSKVFVETRLQMKYWIVKRANNELPVQARQFLVDPHGPSITGRDGPGVSLACGLLLPQTPLAKGDR